MAPAQRDLESMRRRQFLVMNLEKLLKPLRRQGGIACRVLNVAMAAQGQERHSSNAPAKWPAATEADLGIKAHAHTLRHACAPLLRKATEELTILDTLPD
jgi:hypothetical protein